MDLKNYDFIYIEMPDTYGIARGILKSKEYFEKNKSRGIPVDILGPNCLLPKSMNVVGGPGLPSDIGFPDGYFYPDMSSMKPHHSSPDTAFVFGDFRCKANDAGSDHVYSCTRGILKKALLALDNFGFKIYGAFEYEFYLYEREGFEEISVPTAFMMSAVQKKYFGFAKDVMRCMKHYGMAPESYQIEYGIGQFEITMSPDYGINIADNAIRFKELVKEIAKEHGYYASFMSHPSQHVTTSSAHLNHSLWSKDEKNLLYDANKNDNLSNLSKQWLAGLQHHTKAIKCLSASTVNCISRLHEKYTPKDDSWGFDNRLVCYRVKNLDEDRTYIENRIPGAATNPYLALAAVIYSGLDGIQNQLRLKSENVVGDPTKGDCSNNCGKLTSLSTSLREAIKDLKHDRLLCESLGDKFLNCFTQLKVDSRVPYNF